MNKSNVKIKYKLLRKDKKLEKRVNKLLDETEIMQKDIARKMNMPYISLSQRLIGNIRFTEVEHKKLKKVISELESKFI